MTPEAFLSCVGAAGVLGFLTLRYWFRSPGRSVERMLRKIEAGQVPDLPVRTDFYYDLISTDGGFSIRSLKDQIDDRVSVEWERVAEISAYKRDLLTTDQVCVAFTLNNHTFVEIHEEMRGFVELCQKLPTVLPGTLTFSDWYMAITVPAFETCMTSLFTREKGTVAT